jgi:predicted peptidase
MEKIHQPNSYAVKTKKMKNITKAVISLLFLVKTTGSCGQTPTPELIKASDHPIQYYISLPNGWTANSKWPVVIAVEAADKQFKQNAERFMVARKNMPFIIVAPFITTNGQQGHKDSTIYPYSKAVWDTIDKVSICKFDMDGLQSIIRDVKTNYSGTDKIFITGFEAGTHLVWAMIFQHPELLYAAAPVAGNYRSRCMENNTFSGHQSRLQLPIKNFTGADDEGFGVKGKVYYQYLEAKNLAIAHGYKNISETEVANKTHVPLPDEVLNYFFTIWQTIK